MRTVCEYMGVVATTASAAYLLEPYSGGYHGAWLGLAAYTVAANEEKPWYLYAASIAIAALPAMNGDLESTAAALCVGGLAYFARRIPDMPTGYEGRNPQKPQGNSSLDGCARSALDRSPL